MELRMLKYFVAVAREEYPKIFGKPALCSTR